MSSEAIQRTMLYQKAIKEALMKDWDPIGVNEIPEAQDEYDSYVPAIHKLLIAKKSKQEIFDYLWWLETEHMGLVGILQATEQIAERLMKIPAEVEALS